MLAAHTSPAKRALWVEEPRPDTLRVELTNQTAPTPGLLVAGKYQLTRLLGRGGMGSVWEATHTSLGTRVAVKFIDSEHAAGSEARKRFEHEARAAAALHSKHVVDVYDHGTLPDGSPFIVMEFLQGEPLDERLERVGRLTPEETARIIVQVCRGLSKAHAVGIVHRDLKPENVFLVWDDDDGEDVAKVVDFGIAKFTDQAMGVSSSTRTGALLGTPYYMSPEQARGLRSVDHRSDLWSVGVIVFRCLVGKLPFDGESVGDLLVKICTDPVPIPSQWAPDLPAGVDEWVAKALCRDPEQRFASASALSEELARVCGVSLRRQVSAPAHLGSNNHARSDSGSVQASTGAPVTLEPSRSKRGIIATVGVTAALLALAGLVFSRGTDSDSKENSTADAAAAAPLTNAPDDSASPDSPPPDVEARPDDIEPSTAPPSESSAEPAGNTAPPQDAPAKEPERRSAPPTTKAPTEATAPPKAPPAPTNSAQPKKEIDLGY